ncbi:DUF2155 domain-containing protein [Sneathiella sp. P13V-1]|uniref:DUF2155 domain-containing protein n=1 Tax=Sneathiella sp. P13V-1 TaxID=2697366 RepID=UPI002AB20E82|nr:DUF2155 domain-containing protein [Sneathiella sp. P13V-1]
MLRTSTNYLKILSIAVLSAVLYAGAAQAEDLIGSAVKLRALDKITGRTQDIVIPIDEAVKYGTLDITARKCLKRPPEETPETTTFLEIRETPQDEDPIIQFMGWMFASSPALNALEHPVYDVWVIDCIISSDEASEAKE